MKKELNKTERDIILNKATEPPFSGKYYKHNQKGIYICRNCGAGLYLAEHKFDSSCGWPAFDDEIKGAVKRTPDADGHRTEITCSSCGGHLGHVFEGEALTDKNIRHCVNSVSMDFVPDENLETAVFAGGCFWGVEYLMKKTPGVLYTQVGYTGGRTQNPTYKEVCSKTTGHIEALKIVFDKTVTGFETLAKLFFEIHDFTQTDGQGPDLGEQYLSRIFYTCDAQKETAQKLIKILEGKGYSVATRLVPLVVFWPAEDYHQDYYNVKGATPYCHKYTKRF